MSENVSLAPSSKDDDLKKNEETFKKTTLFKNSTQFFEDVKNGFMPFLNGKSSNVNGKDVVQIKPLTIRNAVTGKVLKGTNQLIAQRCAQELISRGEKIKGEILTFEECKKEGIRLLKGKGNFQIFENGKTYRFFFDNSFSDKSMKVLAAARYAAATKRRIESIRSQMDNDISEAEKTVLLSRLAFEHKNEICGNIIRPAAIETKEFGKDAFKSVKPVEISVLEKNEKGEDVQVKKTLEPQLPKLEENVNEYLKNLPQNELEKFNDIIMRTNEKDENKHLSVKNLINDFDEEKYQDNAEKYLAKAQENSQINTKDITIDARNTHDPKMYLAKYLTACQLAKNNSKVIFLTDEQSQKEVQKNLVKSIEKNISEHRHVDVFRIGNEAGLSVKDELKNFRSQQYAIEHPAERKEISKELSNEQSMSF